MRTTVNLLGSGLMNAFMIDVPVWCNFESDTTHTTIFGDILQNKESRSKSEVFILNSTNAQCELPLSAPAQKYFVFLATEQGQDFHVRSNTVSFELNRPRLRSNSNLTWEIRVDQTEPDSQAVYEQ
jgi:protease II